MPAGIDVNGQVAVPRREVDQTCKVALICVSAHTIVAGRALQVYEFSTGGTSEVNLHPLRRVFPASNLWQVSGI